MYFAQCDFVFSVCNITVASSLTQCMIRLLYTKNYSFLLIVTCRTVIDNSLVVRFFENLFFTSNSRFFVQVYRDVPDNEILINTTIFEGKTFEVNWNSRSHGRLLFTDAYAHGLPLLQLQSPPCRNRLEVSCFYVFMRFTRHGLIRDIVWSRAP